MPARLYRILCSAAALLALAPSLASAQKTIRVPADQPTIQAAIDAASTGDTVLVSPGTYYENLTVNRKEVTLKSTDGADKTIIDGGRKDKVIAFLSTFGLASVVDGFTIRNGQAQDAAAYSGIYLNLSGATIQNNVFTSNYGAAIATTTATVNVFNNRIETTLPPIDSAGHCALAIGMSLQSNLQVPLASGNYVPDVIRGNTIEGDPTASCAVGGIVAVSLFDTTIENNIVRYGGYGMVLFMVKGNIRQNLIYGNRSSGLTVEDVESLYPYTDPARIFVTNNTVANNGLYFPLNQSSDVVISGFYSRISLSNNLIVGYGASAPPFSCSTDNLNYPNATPVILDHNDIVNLNPTPYPVSPMQCSDDKLSTEIGVNGNISADPLFAGSGDFHLKTGSPAIDAGNNSAFGMASTDFDGSPRILDSTGLGYPQVDIGAYEHTGIADNTVTTIGLTSSAYYMVAPGNFTLTATPAMTGGAPGGVITIYQDDQLIDTQTVPAGGATTKAVANLGPGLYRYVAVYAPSTGVAPARSTVMYVRVDRYQPTITLTSTPNPSVVGQAVTFTATIQSPDTNQLGPIVLADNSNNNTILATLTPDNTGTVTFTTTNLALGMHIISASFAGDATHFNAVRTVTQRVNAGTATNTVLSSSPNPSVEGQTVTFTATVTAASGTPTGSVQFVENFAVLFTAPLDASGHAVYTTSALAAGHHTIWAYYVPTGTFAGSFYEGEQEVQALTNTINLTSSANPSNYGDPFTLTAYVATNGSQPVTGTVTFYYVGSYLGQQPVDASGKASYTFSGTYFTPGRYRIVAYFKPTGSTQNTASSQVDQLIIGLPSSTVLTANPTHGTAFNNNITLTATVASLTSGKPTPTGQVLFYLNNNQNQLVTLVNGVATVTVTLPGGVNHLWAAYYPDTQSGYDTSNSNFLDVTIDPAPITITLTSRPNPATVFSSITYTAHATITGTQTPAAGINLSFLFTQGTASVLNGAAVTDASGNAVFTNSSLPVGVYTVVSSYAGDTSLHAGASAPITQVIAPVGTSTALAASPNPGYENQPIDFNLSVSFATAVSANTPQPYGTVAVYDGTTLLQTVTLASTRNTPAVTFTLNNLSVGTHTLTATFTPADANFLPSTGNPVSLIILPQSFTVTLSDDHLTIPTGHHRSTTVSINSIGGLTAPFTLTCGTNIPQWTSCQWGQNSLVLPANGTVSTQLTIDTDQLPGFLNGSLQPQRENPFWNIRFAALPVLLLAFFRRHKLRANLPRLMLVLLASLSIAMLGACGANKYPYSTAPGTYSIPISVTEHPTTAGSNPITKVVTLTLEVTD